MSTTSIDPDDQYTARDNAQRAAALIDRDIKLSIALEALRKLVPRVEEYAQSVGPCDHDVGICVCEIVREAEQGALALRLLQEPSEIVEELRLLREIETAAYALNTKLQVLRHWRENVK